MNVFLKKTKTVSQQNHPYPFNNLLVISTCHFKEAFTRETNGSLGFSSVVLNASTDVSFLCAYVVSKERVRRCENMREIKVGYYWNFMIIPYNHSVPFLNSHNII